MLKVSDNIIKKHLGIIIVFIMLSSCFGKKQECNQDVINVELTQLSKDIVSAFCDYLDSTYAEGDYVNYRDVIILLSEYSDTLNEFEVIVYSLDYNQKDYIGNAEPVKEYPVKVFGTPNDMFFKTNFEICDNLKYDNDYADDYQSWYIQIYNDSILCNCDDDCPQPLFKILEDYFPDKNIICVTYTYVLSI